MMSSGAGLIGQLAAGVFSSKRDRTNRITARQNCLWIIKTTKKLKREGRERTKEGQKERRDRKGQTEKARERERGREGGRETAGNIKEVSKKEKDDVSLEEVPAVFVCPLFGPSRALIVHQPGAKPKSHRTLKWQLDRIWTGEKREYHELRKEGGAQSLLFTMNHCRFWKILLLNICLPHPLKLSLREAKELFSDNITGS